jgi:hypothetical protein
VDVVQPTCIAALNLNYPGSRLVVHVLDDGNSSVMRNMVQQLQFQARSALLGALFLVDRIAACLRDCAQSLSECRHGNCADMHVIW